MRIYVSNLSYQVTAEDLRAAFVTFKNVASVFIVKDRATGNSKGFGFVDITPDSEAKAAMDLLNGRLLQGRKMALKVALPPMEQREGASSPQAPPRNDSRGHNPKGRDTGGGGKAPRDRGNQERGGTRAQKKQNSSNSVTDARTQGGRANKERGGATTQKEQNSSNRGPGGRAPVGRGGQGGGRRH